MIPLRSLGAFLALSSAIFSPTLQASTEQPNPVPITVFDPYILEEGRVNFVEPRQQNLSVVQPLLIKAQEDMSPIEIILFGSHVLTAHQDEIQGIEDAEMHNREKLAFFGALEPDFPDANAVDFYDQSLDQGHFFFNVEGHPFYIDKPANYMKRLLCSIHLRQTTMSSLTRCLRWLTVSDQFSSIHRLIDCLQTSQRLRADPTVWAAEDYKLVASTLFQFFEKILFVPEACSVINHKDFQAPATFDQIENFLAALPAGDRLSLPLAAKLCRLIPLDSNLSDEQRTLIDNIVADPNQDMEAFLKDNQFEYASLSSEILFPIIRDNLRKIIALYLGTIPPIPDQAVKDEYLHYLLNDPAGQDLRKNRGTDCSYWLTTDSPSLKEFIEFQHEWGRPVNIVFFSLFDVMSMNYPTIFTSFKILNRPEFSEVLPELLQQFPAAIQDDSANTVFCLLSSTPDAATLAATDPSLMGLSPYKKLFSTLKGVPDVRFVDIPSVSADKIIVCPPSTPEWAPTFMTKLKPGGQFINVFSVEIYNNPGVAAWFPRSWFDGEGRSSSRGLVHLSLPSPLQLFPHSFFPYSSLCFDLKAAVSSAFKSCNDGVDEAWSLLVEEFGDDVARRLLGDDIAKYERHYAKGINPAGLKVAQLVVTKPAQPAKH